MPTPFLIPGLLIILAVWCWPHWQPEPWLCLAGAAACALLALPSRVRRLGIWAGAWCLGCAAPGLVPEGPALRGHAAVAGRVTSTSGHRADIALSEGSVRCEDGSHHAAFDTGVFSTVSSVVSQ